MPATVIVGAQWGDEGKGKIVDLLAQHSDLVCRYQGGPNAGHTIVVGGETYKIRADPVRDRRRARRARSAPAASSTPRCWSASSTSSRLAATRPPGLVFVSGNAHLIMPWHVALDGARERQLGNLQIGTTRRGIGPGLRRQGDAHRDSRPGPARPEDPAPEDRARRRREERLARARVRLEPFDAEEVVSRTLCDTRDRLAPYVADTSLLVDRALRDGDSVLFEGAQGTLLDLDHGTYPFVTSSSPIAAGAAVSFGIGPNRIDEVVGVSKAYVTRVGEGPFPSEIEGDGAAARARARTASSAP